MKTTSDNQAFQDFRDYIDSLEIDADTGTLRIPEKSVNALFNSFARNNPGPAALAAHSLRSILIPRRQGHRIESDQPFSPHYDPQALPPQLEALATTAMLEDLTLSLADRMGTASQLDDLANQAIERGPNLRDVIADAVDAHSPSQEDSNHA